MTDTSDVVVVGAGIVGSAFAKVAAEHGVGVTVLERQTAYRDKVRGEYLTPWGAAEARLLGVEEALIAGGGTWISHFIGYDENMPPEVAESFPIRTADFRPDVRGAMDVGHPQACQALADAAEQAGATVVRGVGDLAVESGPSPVVRYELDDVEVELRCRLVVGADGRASSVRRQLGHVLQQTEPSTMAAGMLVAGLGAWPTDRASLGTEGDLHYFVFPRADGSARLYQFFAIGQRGRFTGPARQREMLDSFRMRCLPLGEEIAASTPAGPVACYPMTDSWVDTPCGPGAVLIGDAAGWSDPIIGQGLSIALRDARMVADVVTGGQDWSPSAFEAYTAERSERMRRLRICGQLETALRCTFTPAGRRRRTAVFQAMAGDPLVAAPLLVTIFAGPEVAPPEAFQPGNIERVLALT